MQNGMMPQQPQGQAQPIPAQPVTLQAAGQIPGQPQSVVNGEDVLRLLLQRVAEMGEEDLEILDSLITEETISMWVKLLPELAPIFKEASAFQGMGGEQNHEEQEPEKDVKMMDDKNPLVSDGLMR